MTESLTEKEKAMMDILGKVQQGRLSTGRAREQILALWYMEEYGYGGGLKWGIGKNNRFITVIANEPIGFDKKEVGGGMALIITAGDAKYARIIIKEKEAD